MEKRNKNQQGGYNIVFNCTCTVNITFNNGMPEINADTPKPKAPEKQSPWNMQPAESVQTLRGLLDLLVKSGELNEDYHPNQLSVPQLAVIASQLFSRSGIHDNNWQFAGILFGVAPKDLRHAYSIRTNSPKIQEYNRKLDDIFDNGGVVNKNKQS